MTNPYMTAKTVDELRSMEWSLYSETHQNGQLVEGSGAYYADQMDLLEQAFATLFPDDYDYHKRGREQLGKDT